MHIGFNNEHEVYHLHNENQVRQAIEQTISEKDLGVTVDPKLNFTLHIEKQVNKANRILGLVRRTFSYIDLKSFKLLFTSLVRPHQEYCVPIWSPRFKKDSKLIENVLRRATRFLPGLKNFSYSERLLLLDLHSMKYRRERGDMI